LVKLMGSKKKQETTQSGTTTNTNTFGQIHPEDTPDVERFRSWQPEADPSIPYRFARARQDISSTRSNPYGSYTTPAVREAAQRTAYGNLQQQEGQAMQEGQADVNQQRGTQLGALASLTSPHIVQTGSSGTSSGNSTQTQSGGLLGDLLLAGVSGGSQGAGAA
jgi:hypothetical protein